MDQNLTRRGVFGVAAIAGVGVAVTACSGSGTDTATAPSAAAGTTAPPAPAGSSAAVPGGAIAKTADVPVGGGIVTESVVVVQPVAGTFKGYSPDCTHKGCKVKSVADGAIVCPCHMSLFAIADGSVTSGPAKKPLPEVAIKVDGDSISLA